MPLSDRPEPGLRERKKARLREQIQSVALALYRERGYEATTVEEICKRVEVSQPTFYNYFPSKEAIPAEHAMRGFGEPLKQLLSDPSVIQLKLRRYFREVAEQMVRDTKLWHAIAISGAYNPVRNPSLLQSADIGTRVLIEVLAQAQKKGELTKEF
jgi:AcrR family transcriptional regulator